MIIDEAKIKKLKEKYPGWDEKLPTLEGWPHEWEESELDTWIASMGILKPLRRPHIKGPTAAPPKHKAPEAPMKRDTSKKISSGTGISKKKEEEKKKKNQTVNLDGTEVKLSTPPNGVIIFCHGSGDTGRGVKFYVESVAGRPILAALRDAGVEFEYPTAASRPYRRTGGHNMRVWYRVGGIEPSHPEDTASVETSVAQLNQVIEDILRAGVPSDKIVLGGFSMGGGIAVQTAARTNHRLGAVFALSSYLCDNSWVWEELGRRKKISSACTTRTESERTVALLSSPVFMAHGKSDYFVRSEWGERTASRLKELGVDVQPFLRVPAHHIMTTDELQKLFEFLLSRVFSGTAPKSNGGR